MFEIIDRSHNFEKDGQQNCYVGDEAMAKRGIQSWRCPIEHGIIWGHTSCDKLCTASLNFDHIILQRNGQKNCLLVMKQ